MSTSTRPKRRSPRPPSEWARIVAKWKSSGLSADQYAKQHGLGATSLWRWNCKLRQRERRDGSQPGNTDLATRFVPLHVVSDAPGDDTSRRQKSAGSIELELPNGCIVKLRGDVSPETIRAALSALQDAVSC